MHAGWRALARMGGAIAALLACTGFGFAQGAVQQAGPVTRNHPVVWIQNGLVTDPGFASGFGPNGAAALGMTENLLVEFGVGTPPYANAGSGPSGTNWCDYDGPVTSTNGYHVLCFGPNANGGGLIYYGYGGAASPLPLTLCVNYSCGALLPAGATAGTPTVANIATLRASPGTYAASGAVNVASYYNTTYIGGGTFALGASGCVDNGGSVVKDASGNCWYRQGLGTSIAATAFGAHCDGVTTVFDGTVTAGSNQFTSSSITFTSADIGKVFELQPGGANPQVTSIAGVNGHVATLQNVAFDNYPGLIAATDLNFDSTVGGGFDNPGSGYKPADVLTVVGGTFTAAATATVLNTGLVAFTMTSGGTGYHAGDEIGLTGTTGVTAAPAIVSVLTVNGSGTILTSQIVYSGRFKVAGNSNPVAFTQAGGHGSGFTFTLLAGDASFGISKTSLTTGGNYSVLPPVPASTTDSGTGTGATIELIFNSPAWTYGSDDTGTLANLETYLEIPASRGVFASAILPGGTCLASSLTINRPVSWYGGGTRSSLIQAILGSSGSTVNGSPPAFLTIATGYPASDPYQAFGAGQNQPGFQNVQITGLTKTGTVNIGATSGVSTTTDCIALANPAGVHSSTNVALIFMNVQAKNCPGNGIDLTNKWVGEVIAYNLVINSVGNNCLDVQSYHNPSRFYRMVASSCLNNGLNIVASSSLEFHGASVFGNAIDVSVTGPYLKSTAGYILFDGLQMGGSTNENMYLDQSNETVYCTGICRFKDANQGGATATGAANSALAIGPDVQGDSALTQPAIVIDGGMFREGDNSNYVDVFFGQDAVASMYCMCVVQVDAATRNVDLGLPTTNKASKLIGPQFYPAGFSAIP